jgi:hypothetical protein
MPSLPARGADVRRLGLRLPPERMPRLHRGRPLKSWRYVGVYGPELMLCVGDARVAGMPQRWWAVALPDGTLAERTTSGRGGLSISDERAAVDGAIELALEPAGEPIEIASAHGRSYIWTRKQPVHARGHVELGGRRFEVDADGLVDKSAGYHARHTSWRWSAGVGRAAGGERVAWNLVEGVHDARAASERTLWVDGEPRELEPVAIAPDLARAGGLEFSEWSAREDHTNRLLFRSDYRQPFGEFGGELPGGMLLDAGYGVMETHDVLW